MYQINALNPKEEGHQARKRFGQNFLHDQRVIAKIVRSVNPRPGENIVEIGPGLAALTSPLIGECDALTVIELDRDLAAGLPGRVPYPERLTIIEADALKYDYTELFQDERPLRVVGNLPYNISTPLLFHLIQFGAKVKDMHFMLQKEVVKRMAALPGESAYGRLGIMVQYYCQVEDLFDVPPTSFDPAPKVDSAIVRLKPYKDLPLVANHFQTFEKLVNVAFQQRRKTLRNSLKQLISVEQMQSLDVDLSLRPEEISLAEYVAISNCLGEL